MNITRIVRPARRPQSAQDALPPIFDHVALTDALGPHVAPVRGARVVVLQIRAGEVEEVEA